jgi:HD-GYP domain-containing protein (c-di-GMP phosphodiesterase class II)
MADESIYEVEELEPLDEYAEDSPALSSGECLASEALLSLPKIKHLRDTMESYSFPALLLNSRLHILYENTAYSHLFYAYSRQIPRSFAQDFPHDLDTDKIGKIYASLHNQMENYSYRGRVQSIHRSRLNQLFNVNIVPVFTDECEQPTVFQAFFDNVTLEQKGLLHSTFLSLLEASKLKDNDTGNHIQRVGKYSRIMSQYLYDHDLVTDITPEFIQNIEFLAQMHDVGKIGTPDDILNKEGPLDEREWEIMQEHTINGAYIMSTYPHPMAREIALFHHEHWDGNGYPYNLTGDMIPVSSRIVAIADVYDALRMRRSYKAAFDHQKAGKIVVDQNGTHFDPSLIDVFVKISDEYDFLFEKLKD